MSIALRMNGRNYAIVTSLSALTPVCSVPTSLHTRIGAQTLARAASPVRIWRTDTGLRACERRWPAIIEAPAKPASRAWQTQQARECRGEPLMRHHCWPERVSSTGDFHVFETFSWCDHRTCKHRLAQFSAHELVFHTRPLCHVNRSVGGAGRRLHLKRANEDNDVNRHRCTQVSGYVGPLLARRGYCVVSAYELARAVKSTARALATPIVTAKATTAITTCFMDILLVVGERVFALSRDTFPKVVSCY